MKLQLIADILTPVRGRGSAPARVAARGFGCAIGAVALLAACATTAGRTSTVQFGPFEGEALDAAARDRPVVFLDRIGWGADAAQLAALRRLGASAFLATQLHPSANPPLPAEAAQQLAKGEVDRSLDALIPPLIQSEQALRQAKRGDTAGDAAQEEAMQKAINQRKNELTQQAMTRQLLYALYSPNQLQERLTWFWMNHFNVFRGGNVGPMMGDYYARVIKPHALGHFRDLLRATVFSPQMLIYLNNAQNARDHVNENYAREIMELHTLGVGNGYTQDDVTKLAAVLTGLGVNLSGTQMLVHGARGDDAWQSGLVMFSPAQHDAEAKTVLGHMLQGQGPAEIEQVIALLAAHPATARHVCARLAQYFAGEQPPAALIDAMAARWRDTDGDVAAVLETLFASPQFAQSLAQPQFKDPVRFVLSAARASFDGRVIVNARPLQGMLDRLGEPLYGRQTPDGYPMSASAWEGPGQITTRFEVARQIAAGAPMLFVPQQPEAAIAMQGTMDNSAHAAESAAPSPPPRPAPPVLARSAVYLSLEPALSETTRRSLAQASNPVLWNSLWLSSPEFMNR